MLIQIINFFSFIITPIASLIIIKNYVKKEIAIKKSMLLSLISLLALFNYFLYSVNYKINTTLFTILLSSIIFKYVFKYNTTVSIVSALLSVITLSIGDIFCAILFAPFFDIQTVRSNVLLMVVGNLSVGIIGCLISYIKTINNNVNKFIEKTSSYDKIGRIIFLFLSLFSILILIFVISKNFEFIIDFVLAIILIFSFLFMCIILIKENNTNIKLEYKYDLLFEYLQTFEEVIERNGLINHEYKNQLATIRNMKSIDKIQKYIDSLLTYNLDMPSEIEKKLSLIPKGGLKGLIHYKLLIANSKKLNIMIDISRNVYKRISIVDDDLIRIISQLIGIYFDNAIDAAYESNNKQLSCEIYCIKSNLNIVISNSIDYKVNINAINKKGYSSKGKGRGNGLYYSEKLLKNNENIEVKTNIINNFFIKQIIIKTKK